MRSYSSSIPVILLTLLVFATAVFILTDEGSEAFPSINNTKGSGVAALAELLRLDGYEVKVDLRPKPELELDDIVVNIVFRPASWESAEVLKPTDPQVASADQLIDKHLHEGGTQLLIGVPRDFTDASLDVTTATVIDTLTEQDYKVTELSDASLWAGELPYESKGLHALLAKAGSDSVFFGARVKGDGTQFIVHSGMFLTNRFIADHDNAKYAIDLFRRIAPKNSRIVFVETRFGNVQDPGLLATIGNWANVAWWQLVLTLVIAIFTFNRRFGLATSEPARARMTGEVLQAFAATLRRAKRADQALLILVEAAYERITAATRAPAGLPPNEITKLAPPMLQMAITEIRAKYGQEITSKEAVRLAGNLERELEEFEKMHRSRRAPAGQIK
ncbi:hypothetical protein QPK87_05355 [Kamptonema cortianum]|nr:hypothetical protein [Geitlerinema splendidum]MDK3156004.1 hypothetical protein [Kamptonema cortianum]